MFLDFISLGGAIADLSLLVIVFYIILQNKNAKFIQKV